MARLHAVADVGSEPSADIAEAMTLADALCEMLVHVDLGPENELLAAELYHRAEALASILSRLNRNTRKDQ